MSGGYFDRNIYAIGEIAASIEHDIARALRPKPEKVHKDYWTIYEHDSPCSCRSFGGWGYMAFDKYEEAESFLLSRKGVVKAEERYIDRRRFEDDVVFQSTDSYMVETPNEEHIPVLYTIHHCIYNHYPDDADVLELTDETIETMKEAYRQIRIAEIYATRIDWMMSGDDGEDDLQERLNEDLEAFEKEFQTKDWACSYEDDED
ncbi:MAG: hypothetical protein ACLRPS_01100 [Paraprevotella clara]|uniref:Uncharacterized protein n=1 Tax=Paraprevotella clara TaxID=454154 RepID=A0A6N3GCW3_9BACT